MKIVFLDETENSNILPGFYGICAVVVDVANYSVVRREIEAALDAVGWSRDREFKGNTLFSSGKGDTTVPIDDRIEAAAMIVGATIAASNARCVSAFARNTNGNGPDNHVSLVQVAIEAGLARNRRRTNGKDLCAVYADSNATVPFGPLSRAVNEAVTSRGYVMVEDVVPVDSSCAHPGILLADVLAHMAMWTYAGHESGNPQGSLFDEVTGRVPPTSERKLVTVQRVLEHGAELKFKPRLPG